MNQPPKKDPSAQYLSFGTVPWPSSPLRTEKGGFVTIPKPFAQIGSVAGVSHHHPISVNVFNTASSFHSHKASSPSLPHSTAANLRQWHPHSRPVRARGWAVNLGDKFDSDRYLLNTSSATGSHPPGGLHMTTSSSAIWRSKYTSATCLQMWTEKCLV